ncbi:putative LOC100569746 [Trichonephila clavipes]|nr:putative LOC100569746 [Trichonephila clavipes]
MSECTVGDRLTNRSVNEHFHERFLCSDNEHFQERFLCLDTTNTYSEVTPEIMDEILTTARDLELEVNEDDIEELIMAHEDELTTEELQEILNEEHQETAKCELRFQQDGATCHTALATIDLLKDTFGDRLISRFGPVNWPPRSCDLTPLDYFLWVYVKSLVYADKPQTLDHLEDNIRRVIADIRPQMLEKVIENWTSRLDYIRASGGSHMPEIIFKM